jgi:hypothetical protein
VGSVCLKKCDSAPPSVKYTLSTGGAEIPFSHSHRFPQTHTNQVLVKHSGLRRLAFWGCFRTRLFPLEKVVVASCDYVMISFVCIFSPYCKRSGFAALMKLSVRSYLVGNAGSRPISEAKQPWACLVLGWGTTGEAHVLYSLLHFWLKK